MKNTGLFRVSSVSQLLSVGGCRTMMLGLPLLAKPTKRQNPKNTRDLVNNNEKGLLFSILEPEQNE
jgi:hypothetical protein